MKIKNAILLCPFLTTLSVFGAEAPSEETPSWKVSVGYGMGFKKNLRKNNTYEDMDKDIVTKSIPLVQGSVGRFSLEAQGLSFLVLGNRFSNVSAFINRGGDRYHGAGMTPRKDSFFAGVSLKFMKYGLSASKDINGHSKGHIINASYSHFIPVDEKLLLNLSASVAWHDDRYSEYYYGVRSHEAISGRPEYHAKNYFQPGVGAFPIYKLSEKISVLLGLNLKYVPEKIRQSPTMNGDKIEYGGLLGANFSL